MMGSRSDEIIKRLPENETVVGIEVGVRYGKNAVHILEGLPLAHLWLVDTWSKPAKGDSYYNSGDGIADRPPAYWNKCWRDFKVRIGPFESRVEIMRMRSLDAAAFIARNYSLEFFDFVFIDADHSFNGVTRDIIAWYPLVKQGGWIGGHDYAHPRIGGVKQAIDGIFPADRIEIGSDMTWFVKREG